MLSVYFSELFALHAGTSLVISQATLTLMFVVLGILLVGIGFGFFAKNKENLLQHRWSMTMAVALALIAIFFVMAPSFVRFYIDPDAEFFSTLSYITIIHMAIGVPTVTLGVIYAFGDLPQKTKRWMRYAAVFWSISLVVGVVLFLEMLGLLPM